MTRRQWLLGAAGLIVLSTLAYFPSINSPFTHYDDPLYITNNLARISAPGWDGLLLQWNSNRAWQGDFVEFFPLRDTVYWLIFQRWQLNPLPYHTMALVFHIACVLLLWRFLRQLAFSERAAWLGALLFALHPVHIESVVWIAGLKDPMYTMFMLLSLSAYASYREEQRWWKYALMLFGLVCGFLVKSLIVVLPMMLLMMEVLLPPRAKWKEIAMRLAGPFVFSGLFFLQITGIGRANQVIVNPHHGSWMNHWVLVVWSQVKYLKQALLPTQYRLIYCFEPAQGLSDWRFWVGLLILGAVAALVWRWRHEPVRLLLVSIYVLAMLPVSNIVPFPAIMADRYLYAATIGSCGLLALLIDRVQRPRSFVAITAAAALLLTGATASRAWVWNDEELLWEEPDTDPACVTDPAFPPAQSHVLRCIAAKDPHNKLLALERAMVSPGFYKIGEDLICSTIIGTAQRARELGDVDGENRAIHWAKMGTRMCPTHPAAWNVAMFVTLHKQPRIAHAAAVRAWRLAHGPDTEVLVWLTALELGDPQAPAEITRIAKLEDRGACEKVLMFANDVPTLGPQFGEAVSICNDYLTDVMQREGSLVPTSELPEKLPTAP